MERIRFGHFIRSFRHIALTVDTPNLCTNLYLKRIKGTNSRAICQGTIDSKIIAFPNCLNCTFAEPKVAFNRNLSDT
ncbi:MAG: hypothetical protein ACK4UP_02135 [Spirosomataceae bacterium]